MKELFSKKYDGESLYDLQRDILEALDEVYNPRIKDIPKWDGGIQKGIFTVTITWENART